MYICRFAKGFICHLSSDLSEGCIFSKTQYAIKSPKKRWKETRFALRKWYLTSVRSNSRIYCFANMLLGDVLFSFVSRSSFSFKGTFTLIFSSVLCFLCVVNTKLPCARQCSWNYMIVLIQLFRCILKPASLALLLLRNSLQKKESKCDCCHYNAARFVNEMIISLFCLRLLFDIVLQTVHWND